jgi:hypothetical protein
VITLKSILGLAMKDLEAKKRFFCQRNQEKEKEKEINGRLVKQAGKFKK